MKEPTLELSEEDDYYYAFYRSQQNMGRQNAGMPSDGKPAKRKAPTKDQPTKFRKITDMFHVSSRASTVNGTLRQIVPMCGDIYDAMLHDGLLQYVTPVPSKHTLRSGEEKKGLYVNTWIRSIRAILDTEVEKTCWSKVELCVCADDPYPTPGTADGMAFSCRHSKSSHPPPTLIQLCTYFFKSLRSRDMTPLAQNGMLCINTSFTRFVQHSGVSKRRDLDEQNQRYRDRWQHVVSTVLGAVLTANAGDPKFQMVLFGLPARKMLQHCYNQAACTDNITKLASSSSIHCFSHPSPRATASSDCYTLRDGKGAPLELPVHRLSRWTGHEDFVQRLYGTEDGTEKDPFRLRPSTLPMLF